MKTKSYTFKFVLMLIISLLTSMFMQGEDCPYIVDASNQVVIDFTLPRRTTVIDGIYSVVDNKITFTFDHSVNPTFQLTGPDLDEVVTSGSHTYTHSSGDWSVEVRYTPIIPNTVFELNLNLNSIPAITIQSFTITVTVPSDPLTVGDTVNAVITSLYNVSDPIPGELDGEATFTNCPNQPPELVPISSPQSATVGAQLEILVESSDDNPYALLSYAITSSSSPTIPTAAAINFTDNGDGTGSFTYTPPLSDAGGSFTVTFTATDNLDSTLIDTQDVEINIGAVNNPPELVPISSPQSATVGAQLEILVESSDDNPYALLSYAITSSSGPTIPTAAAINFTDNGDGTGSFTYTPPLSDAGGSFTVTFTATDNLDSTLQATLDVVINVSRAPKEVVMVIDHSGSMIGEKWDTTVTAANTFINLLYDLNFEFPDAEKDKYGVISYTSSTGGYTSWVFGVTPADEIETRPLSLPDPALNIDTLWPAQDFSATPTGDGLTEAINLFQNLELPDGTDNEKYILLLTDGQNNAGFNTIDDFVTAFGSHANPQINALKVYSVVIGDDSYIWPERIADLSVVDTEGEYRVTDDPVILPEFFAQILGDIVIAEEILPNTVADEFCSPAPVDSYCIAGEDKVAFIATWDRSEVGPPPPPYHLRVTGGPSAQEINPTNYSSYINVKKSYSLPNDSYTYYIFKETTDPPGPFKAEMDGAWWLTLVDNTNAPVTVPSARFFVLHDLKVRTHFSFDRKKHGTGDRIVFKAEIKESGQPVLNANVKVNIKRPGEGAGELLFLTPPPPLTVSRKAKKDVLSPFFLHMNEVFKVLGRDYLLSLADGLTLQDNGTGEDEVAGDGIYTGVFSNLRYEGNYTFKFTAIGTSPQNRTFARTKTISQFVRVNVAPDLSKFIFWVKPKIYDGLIREVWVLYEPVDKFGSHLGPYRSDYLKYEFTGGEPQDKIQYNFDQKDKKGGKYYQRILFNDRKQLPRVRVNYQGSPIGKQLTLRTFDRFEISVHSGLFANYRVNEEQEVKFASTSPVYFLRLAYNPRKTFGFEANAGVTPTTDKSGDKGRFIHCGVNVYYNFPEAKFVDYQLTPFVTTGVGAFLYRGFGENEESFAWNFGVGFKYSLGNLFELRYDIRHFMSFGAYGSKTRNHLQATAGIAFSLK